MSTSESVSRKTNWRQSTFEQWLLSGTSGRSHNHQRDDYRSDRLKHGWASGKLSHRLQVHAAAGRWTQERATLLRSRTNWQADNKEPKHSGDQMTLGRQRLKVQRSHSVNEYNLKARLILRQERLPLEYVLFLTHVWSQADACTHKKANNNNSSSCYYLWGILLGF